MSSRIEGTRHIEPRELARSIQSKAEFALDQMRIWLPALNTKTAGRGIIVGMLGLVSIACSPKPEPPPTPTPIVRVEPTPVAGSPRPPEPPIGQKEVVQRKTGIYVKTLVLEQTDAPVRNHLIYTQLPVTKVIDIEAVDPQNNTAGFGFVETTDNQSRVVFRTSDNNAVNFSYTSAATVDVKDQKVNVEYLTTHDKFAFLRFGLNKTIQKQAGETDEQYKDRVTKLLKDPSFQQEIQDTLGKPEQIEQVVIANPYTKTQAVFDTKKGPSFLDQLLAVFSPKTAYAAAIPAPTPPAPASTSQKPPEPPPAKKVGEEEKSEVKQSEEWEKYFTMVSKEEARSMLEEAKRKGEFKFLFPQFDLQEIKEFSIENRKRAIPRSGLDFYELLVKGIPVKTVFYSNFDGEAWPAAIGTKPPKTEISGNSGDFWFILSIPRVAGPDKILLGPFRTPKNTGTPVEIGTPMAVMESTEYLPEESVPGKWQVQFFIKKQNPDGSYDFTNAKPENILMKNGKIAMVRPGNK